MVSLTEDPPFFYIQYIPGKVFNTRRSVFNVLERPRYESDGRQGSIKDFYMGVLPGIALWLPNTMKRL